MKELLRNAANNSKLAHRVYLSPWAVNLYKSMVSRILWLRGLTLLPSSKRITNLFHAAPQKTGSMWIESVLSDRRIRGVTGLRTYPSHRYEWTEFHEHFPRGTFVPGLYISYDKYEEIEKPERYATFYVIRDPRDILVSFYFSMRDSHRLMGKVQQFHEDLAGLDEREGLHYCIDALQVRWYQMRNWLTHAPGDPQVLVIRFEDLIDDPAGEFRRILYHAGFEVDSDFLDGVLRDYTFEKMKQRDPPKRPGDRAGSNYRSGRQGNWQEHLDDSHIDHLQRVAGDLVEFLGYPSK